MDIVKAVMGLAAAIALLGFGVFLILKNHVVTVNLLCNAGMFETKIVKTRRKLSEISKCRYIEARIVMYLIGCAFIAASFLGIFRHFRMLMGL